MKLTELAETVKLTGKKQQHSYLCLLLTEKALWSFFCKTEKNKHMIYGFRQYRKIILQPYNIW